ncbi:unnamed protein product [Brachionus calyciflorus]|uniref:Uncharacterized protein n=1 Tax=Brachionus calyciflorus TaxID=104777 RepID=A0A814A9Q0_9BILA|nr:unnamed protein product [Brachionus calyciflorus]
MFLFYLIFVSSLISLSLQQCKGEIKCSKEYNPDVTYCYTDQSQQSGSFKYDGFKSCYKYYIQENPSRIKQIRIEFHNSRPKKIDQFPLDFNFLSLETTDFYARESDFNSLLDLSNLTRLKKYSMFFCKLTKLESNFRIPFSVESLDFEFNLIEFISEDFFRIFPNLKNINLKKNQVKEINRLEFNSNFLKYLDFQFMNLEIFNEIFFFNNRSDSNFTINFDINKIRNLPRINGNLRRIPNYIIGHQSKQNLLYNKSLRISDRTDFIIENFTIYSQHFFLFNKSDAFQCLIDYGVILNVNIYGKKAEKYAKHSQRNQFNFNKCQKHVVTKTTTSTTTKTTSTTTPTTTSTTSISTTTPTTTSTSTSTTTTTLIYNDSTEIPIKEELVSITTPEYSEISTIFLKTDQSKTTLTTRIDDDFLNQNNNNNYTTSRLNFINGSEGKIIAEKNIPEDKFVFFRVTIGLVLIFLLVIFLTFLIFYLNEI